MSESLHCSNCGEEATVHLTQIVNNKIIKVDLCESCAQTKGVTDPEGFSLADLLQKTQTVSRSGDPQLSCSNCGMSTADFRRTGRLGCSSCFEVFSPLLRPVLEDMHVGTQHQGKVPERALQRQNKDRQLKSMECALEAAIDEEAYEEAAKLRDQIRALQEAESEAETVRS
jgi:protein arginine kinase activator